MAIVYTPKFTHREWVDNVDRVQAGGENGFNDRFHALEAEFEFLSDIVGQINTAIGSLGQVVAAPVTVGLTPLLEPFANRSPWSPVVWSRVLAGQPLGTFVEKPTANDQAWGVMPLSLPNGVKLKTLKVLGDLAGTGTVQTELVRELRVPPFDRTTLVTITGFSTPTGTPAAIPNSPAFTGDTHLFYLVASVTGSANQDVKLRSFQLTYEP
jgi:hypothetical protein